VRDEDARSWQGRPGAVAAVIALVFLAPAVTAAPIDVIRACAAGASATVTGVDKLAAACPDLEGAITSTGLDRILAAGWRERLSTAQLRDLVEIAARYQGANARVLPDTRSLDGILRGLKPPAPKAESWWGSFKEWWQDWLARSDSALAKWLREMSGHVGISQGVLTVVAYCLAAIIAVVVLIVGLREFRLWGQRRKQSSTEKKAAPPAANLGAALIVPDQPNSAEERLSRVLRALVMRLLETGRLSAERSLTHRELASRSRFDDEAQRGAFAGVATVAEALVYGPRGAAQSAIPQAIERGESLLAQLQPAAQ
jgi:hypothetical protein